MPNGQWPVLYNQVCGCNREALWLTALLRPRDERGVRMTCSTIVWGMLWGMGEHANVECPKWANTDRCDEFATPPCFLLTRIFTRRVHFLNCWPFR